MIKKVLKSIICFLLVFSFLCPVNAAQQTLGELKSEYQKKVNEKAENDRKSDEAKAEIERDRALKLQAEKDIHIAEEEMEECQLKIDESNKKIEELTKEAESILLYLQQLQGENAYVEYISGASTITDFITRVAAVEQLSDHIQATMKELEAEVKRNEELKKELEIKKKNLEQKAKEYEAAIAARVSDLASYDKYALDIDTQIKSLKTKLDDAKNRCSKWAPEKGDSAVINIDCIEPIYDQYGQVIAVGNDGWLKPTNYGVITSEVGPRWGSYHNALDIGWVSTFEGTPVYAAASGVVSGRVSQYSCGGNMLFVDVMVNGVAYTTYYYHLLKFNVNVGDVVTQGTVLGWVGGWSTSSAHGGYDNCTTGAHLHFGVAKGFYNGYSVPRSNVITPPGFPNQYGWRYNSRTDMYRG